MRKKRYQLDHTKFLSIEEETRLVKSLETASKRDRLLIVTALKTGARASELLAVTKDDLNNEHKAMFIRGLKGSLDRLIPLETDLYEELVAWSMGMQNSDRLFNISYSGLVKIWSFYKPNGKSFHCLRHTFAIRLFARSQNLKVTQVALGHTNIQNTMIYADYQYAQTELRKYLGV